MPYNKQLTNQACLGRTGEHWHRGSTTEDQHSPVRPLHSVNKRFIFYLGVWEMQDQINETSSAVKKNFINLITYIHYLQAYH